MLNARELHARYEIMVETYNKTVNVEGQLMVLMANRYVLPAALTYQKQVAQSVAAVKAAGGKSAEGKKLLDRADEADRRAASGAPTRCSRRSSTKAGDAEKHAKHFRDAVVPGDGGAAGDRRRARSARPARDLAARHLSRDAVHQVAAFGHLVIWSLIGSSTAQEDFLTGLAQLHNFEYGPAAELFRKAQAADRGSRWCTGARR